LVIVHDLDLLDEPIQAQPDRGIADPVCLGHRLERAGGEDEPLGEGEVFLAEEVDPGFADFRVGCHEV